MSGHKINDLLILQLQMCESNDGCLEKKCLNQKSNQIIKFENLSLALLTTLFCFFLKQFKLPKTNKGEGINQLYWCTFVFL